MHATPLFRADGVQVAGQSLVVGPSLHHEAAGSAARTIVREAEEGKGLGAPVAAGLPSLGRESTEFQESRFIIVQRQAKRDEARPKGDQHLLPNTVSTTTSARLFVSPATSATSLMSAAFVRLPSVTGSSFVQGSAVTATGARLLPPGGNPWAQ